MMQSGNISPALDDPILPEFRSTTLSLANSAAKPMAATASTTPDGLDTVDLTSNSGKETSNRTLANSTNPIGLRHHSTSPGSSETLYSASPSSSTGGLAMAQGYFSSRESMLQRAVDDCKSQLLPLQENGTYLGCWLLTLVDHWDNEKERVVFLCARAIFIVKYDFITLSVLDHHRLPLDKLTTLTIGNLEYPTRSITPRVQYVANRISSFVRGCLQLGQEAGQNGLNMNLGTVLREKSTHLCNDEAVSERQGREGARLCWRTPVEPNLTQIWNPWSKDIPFITFISHPLLTCKGEQKDPKFDVQDFITSFRNAVQAPPSTDLTQTPDRERCFVEYKPIIMESYVGLPALVHNYGQLGFYKVRGKVSF